MSDSILTLINEEPVLSMFLVIAAGLLIGNIRIGGFSLGSVVGVLIAGLVLGNFGVTGNAAIQTLGIVLFIFSVGYQAGPKFIEAIKKDGRRYFIISLIVALSGFITCYLVSNFFLLEPGYSAGVLAGSLTSKPTLAASLSTIESAKYVLPVGYNLENLKVNITTSYAITYIFGFLGLILIIRFLPGILGIDLVKVATKLDEQEGARRRQAAFSPSDVIVRALRIESEEVTGIPMGQLYKRFPMQFTIQKVIRAGELIEPDHDLELQLGDLVSIIGVLDDEAVKHLEDRQFGTQVRNRELLRYDSRSVKICVTRKHVAGKTLEELNTPVNYASFVSRVSRLGVDMEVTQGLKIQRGDVIDVTGPPAGLEALGKYLGYLEKDIEKTDLSTFSWTIVLGILLGAISISILGVKVDIGLAVGLLGMGILVGYLRSVFPIFGRVPEGARWIFTELGLLLFMSIVGLQAGSGLLESIQNSGLKLLLSSSLVTIIPFSMAYIIGIKVFKMNPLMLLGSIAGSMTHSGALNVLNRSSESEIANIGYTGAYAFANVILTLAGALIVLF